MCAVSLSWCTCIDGRNGKVANAAAAVVLGNYLYIDGGSVSQQVDGQVDLGSIPARG